MAPQSIRRWLSRIVAWVVAFTAMLYVHRVGGFQLVELGVCWGIFIALGMEYAIRSATQESWERKPSKLISKPKLGLFLLIVFFPACIAIFWSGPVTAASLAVTILFAFALVPHLCKFLFGSRQKPNPGETLYKQ